MFKRILVPIDPSKPFAGANEYAVDLAHRFGSRIVATYVIDENLMGPGAQTTTGAMDEALEWVGRDAMDDFAEHHPDLDIQKTLAYGSSPTALFQTVLQCGADLMVLGGFHSTVGLWGSIVGDIVHHAERSCFVVRHAASPPKEGDSIVVPYDGSQHPRATLDKIIAFAKACTARVDLVYVAPKKKEDKALNILKEGAGIVAQEGVPVDYHVLPANRWRSKARMIRDHARAQKSVLIAASRLGHASLHTGRSRTVGWLIGHSEIPVWVVRR